MGALVWVLGFRCAAVLRGAALCESGAYSLQSRPGRGGKAGEVTALSEVFRCGVPA